MSNETLEKRPNTKTDKPKMKNKEIRHYVGAAGVFILVVALMLFLAYNDIFPIFCAVKLLPLSYLLSLYFTVAFLC